MILQGKKIFITGGSKGIGASCVRICSDLGADVGFTYLTGDKNAKELKDRSRAPGRHLSSYRADVRDRTDLVDAMGSFSSSGSRKGIDGIVVNAGIYMRTNFADLSPEEWSRTISTNLDGAFHTVKAGADLMERGAIVFISSQLAFRGSESGVDYSASKAGILGLARSLARELAPDIRVNSVAPGFVDTDILSSDTDEKRRWREQQVPLGRIAGPPEVANTVAFLLSDMSSYITGATIDVNGGLYIH
ncbi:MAG: SDR family oxidoreductase [Thermoplasmata archaeon]|nr:SDR family oxidoreductase [Thermoplasmata archaeon]